jgi:hypothetical protein
MISGKLTGTLLAGVAIATCLAIGAERAVAFRGGGFGGFHGGFNGYHGGFGGVHGGLGGYHGGSFSGGVPVLGMAIMPTTAVERWQRERMPKGN